MSGPRATIAVIGAGAAGLSAAWHGARRGHHVVVADPLGPGGQLANAGTIDTIPGLPAPTSGPELVARMVERLDEHDVEWVDDRIVDVRSRAGRFQLATGEGVELVADAVIVATGARARELDVPGARELADRGVSHCAACDGPLFRDRSVAVVGGGDAAADAVLSLAETSSRVHLLHRGAAITAVPSLRRRLDELANLERHADVEVCSILGTDAVTAIEIADLAGERSRVDVVAVFIAVGVEPDASAVARLVELDASGRVRVDPALMSNVPGVFAVGAVRAGESGQLAGAIGDGVAAAASADRWLTGDLTSAPVARPSAHAAPVERTAFRDYADFFDAIVEAGIGDGLPFVPPTQARFDRFAAALGRDPAEELVVLPGERRLTYADVVVPAIMAGCRPEYGPVVVAAAESLLLDVAAQPERLRDAVPVIVVNGPARNAIDVNCSDGLFGPGWRANATIGRAIRLFVHGHLAPDGASGWGDPGQLAFCFGEDEEKSPWRPLHVERGLDPAESAATVFVVDVYRHLLNRASADADGILEFLRLFLRGRAAGTRLFGDTPLSIMLVVGQELRRHLAPQYSKEALRSRLFDLVTEDDGTPFGPIALRDKSDITFVGAGGLATPALWCFISTTPPPRTVRIGRHD